MTLNCFLLRSEGRHALEIGVSRHRCFFKMPESRNISMASFKVKELL
jgi:hypothetical protein